MSPSRHASPATPQRWRADGHSLYDLFAVSRVIASAVTSAEILVRTLSSPGPDVVFNSSAARRKASRRNNRAVIASN
jgi:hypothetical protein